MGNITAKELMGTFNVEEEKMTDFLGITEESFDEISHFMKQQATIVVKDISDQLAESRIKGENEVHLRMDMYPLLTAMINSEGVLFKDAGHVIMGLLIFQQQKEAIIKTIEDLQEKENEDPLADLLGGGESSGIGGLLKMMSALKQIKKEMEEEDSKP